MAKRGSGIRGFAFGVVVGVAIGAVAALVLSQPTEPGESAPGTQTNLDGLATQLRDRYEVALALGQDAYERAKEEVMLRYNRARSNG